MFCVIKQRDKLTTIVVIWWNSEAKNMKNDLKNERNMNAKCHLRLIYDDKLPGNDY